MQLKLVDLIRVLIVLILSIFFSSLATLVQASCKGCLCVGDPCRLCSLPPMTTDVIAEDEPETCKRIRDEVAPISSPPGTNEYFASLDKSTMACIKNGGDVIKNSRRSEAFPARVYCKPYAPAKN
ncbi:hypothetical protein SAMN05421755_100370 [Nitrosomonas sp. Nm33]|nr:hypothetical protein SAMN05421755_100370 [Nitrosomonas sp. Nm33]